MASPEQRIYENGPAPTPQELKDGLKLLINIYGKGEEIRTFNVGNGEKQTDGKHNTVIQFRSGLDENGSGCIGFNIWKRHLNYSEPDIPPQPSSYQLASAFEVHLGQSGRLIAVDHQRNNGRELTTSQRKDAGEIILNAWEAAVRKNPIPSKR
ncbi:MAG: hypothetical protein KA035_02135 [Candidatus Levybacteria bacterium]|nr:hypothetical protein [Candidatus Levybacteria bacterium]